MHWEGQTLGVGDVPEFTDVLAIPTGPNRVQYYQFNGARDDEGRFVFELLHPEMPVSVGRSHVRRSH